MVVITTQVRPVRLAFASSFLRKAIAFKCRAFAVFGVNGNLSPNRIARKSVRCAPMRNSAAASPAPCVAQSVEPMTNAAHGMARIIEDDPMRGSSTNSSMMRGAASSVLP